MPNCTLASSCLGFCSLKRNDFHLNHVQGGEYLQTLLILLEDAGMTAPHPGRGSVGHQFFQTSDLRHDDYPRGVCRARGAAKSIRNSTAVALYRSSSSHSMIGDNKKAF